MSMTSRELAVLAESLAMQLIEELHEVLVHEPSKPTEEEAAAVVEGTTLAAAALQAYLIVALPEPQCYNVRAVLEHAAQMCARRRGSAASPSIIVSGNDTNT